MTSLLVGCSSQKKDNLAKEDWGNKNSESKNADSVLDDVINFIVEEPKIKSKNIYYVEDNKNNIIKYNKEGNIISETMIDLGGNITSERIFEYENEHLVKETYQEDSFSFVTSYDGQGNQESYVVYYENEVSYGDSFVNEYDSARKLLCTQRYDYMTEELFSICRYEYDKAGNRIKEIYYDSYDINTPVSEIIWEYNEKNQLIKEYTYDSMAERYYKIEYEPDNNNKTTHYSSMDGVEYIVIEEKEFDDHGNVKKWIQFDSITGEHNLIWKYRYEYQYDEDNNLIGYTTFKDGNKSEEVVIEYY